MISGNGLESGPLAGWVIVTEQGIRYIGRVDGPLLRPAYELLVGFGMAPNGQMTVSRQAIPIMTFASIESWKPRDDANVVMVDGLSMHERRELLKAVLIAEKIIAGMRAAESNLTIATDMPKIDPSKLLRKP